MKGEQGKEKQFENALEVVLKGAPEAVNPVIRTVASELNFEGWKYDLVREEESLTSGYTKFLIHVSRVEEESTYLDSIGIITTQLLPENRTLFRIPPFQEWRFRDYMKFSDGRRIPIISQAKDFYSKVGESFFTEFLTHLFTEFQRLGFVDFREKPPIGFKLPHWEN